MESHTYHPAKGLGNVIVLTEGMKRVSISLERVRNTLGRNISYTLEGAVSEGKRAITAAGNA